jgi:hypothetical protein
LLILNLGRRRVGKTTLAYKQSLTAPTRLIFDPRGQFKTSNVILHDTKELYARLDDTSEITVRPLENVRGVFDATCQVLKQWTDDNPEESVSFLVDESYFIDTPNEEYRTFDAMLRFSGTKQIKIIMTAHRPADISVSIRAIADYICMFRMTQEHDLKVVIGKCGQEVASIVSNLKPREYVSWDDGDATFRVMREPSKWFVNLEPKKEQPIHA